MTAPRQHYAGLTEAGVDIIGVVTPEGQVYPAAVVAHLQNAPAALVSWPYQGEAEDKRMVIRLNAAGFDVPQWHRYPVLGRVLAVVARQDGPNPLVQHQGGGGD